MHEMGRVPLDGPGKKALRNLAMNAMLVLPKLGIAVTSRVSG
jgi:hypothetical protein